MKKSSLRMGVIGGILFAVALGLLLVHFSSAQTVDSSTSPTSTFPADSTAADLSTQPPSSSPISISSDETPSSTPADLSQLSSSGTSDVSSTPMVMQPPAVTTDLISSTTTVSSTIIQSVPLSLPPPPPVPTGYPTCDQTIKNVPGDFPSIQAAINATSFGDTVKIAAGTYNENLNLKSGICLEGVGVDQTIISKSGASGIAGEGVSYVIVKNLTVKNSGCAPGVCGGGGNGGGIRLSRSTNITVQSCHLTGNVAVNGGGMLVSDSSVIVDHCLIDNNTANNIGGGLVVESDLPVTLTNVTVANNSWSNSLGNGGVGGMSSYGSGLRMANSILWGNTKENFSGDGSGVSNSDIGGWSGGTNNTNSNPNFVSGYILPAVSL